MWILMNDSMLSVVRHNVRPDDLLVRARLPGDIERVFPKAEVVEGAGSDYQFRAVLPRLEVAEAISSRLLNIDYGNFKASVRQPDRHDAYLTIWGILHKMQQSKQ